MTATRDEPRRGAAALDRGILAAIRERPTSFTFFQLVRLMSRLFPSRARVGGWSDPSREVVRFRSSNSLSFPAEEVERFPIPAEGLAPDGAPPEMVVNMMGLTGPVGILPHHYTEHASARTAVRDSAFRDFLDLFHHRAIALFYRAWEKGRITASYESGDDDRFLAHLLDVAGLGTAGLRHRLPTRDETAGYFAGLLGSQARPAEGLARLVADYFDVPVTIEEFIGEWRSLAAGGQCALDEPGERGRLGFGVLGDAAWDPHARVRLRIGPLTRVRFDEFLPAGTAHEALRSLVRLHVDGICGVDAQLVLSRDDVPACVLGAPAGGRAARDAPGLGRGTWLASRALARDPDETILRLC